MLIYKQRYKPKTTREFTKSDLTVYDSADNTALNALTVYGKSEVVDGTIKSAGEGWSTVDLGTLEWGNASEGYNCFYNNLPNTNGYHKATLMAKYTQVDTVQQLTTIDKTYCRTTGAFIVIHDTDYTDATAFKNSLNGVILAYELADPTQGNAIAVKTDNGSGIDGTMAVFSTGTPLRGIPDTEVRDVMAWDGSAGTVTKNCNGLKITDIGWTKNTLTIQGVDYVYWSHYFTDIKRVAQAGEKPTWILSDKYEPMRSTNIVGNPSTIGVQPNGNVLISTEDPTDDTITPSGNFVYELATPITMSLTTVENASIAGLRTFEPQTHAQNNAQTEMTVDYTIRVPTI